MDFFPNDYTYPSHLLKLTNNEKTLIVFFLCTNEYVQTKSSGSWKYMGWVFGKQQENKELFKFILKHYYVFSCHLSTLPSICYIVVSAEMRQGPWNFLNIYKYIG